MTTRKKLPGSEMDPRQCIEREARSLVTSRFAGMREKPPTSMLVAYTDLMDAAYDAAHEEGMRLRSDERLSFAEIAESLGVSRQAVQQAISRALR